MVEGEGEVDLSRVRAVSCDEVLQALEMTECKALVLMHSGDNFLHKRFEEEIFAHEMTVLVAVRVEHCGHLFCDALVFLTDLP
jgi:hypothetical protein